MFRRKERMKMRVCMTHYAFYPTTGGVESHLLELSSELVRQGHEVFALVGSREGSPAEEEVQGVHIFRRDWMNPEVLRERKRAAGFAAPVVLPELQREVRENYRAFITEHRCDVVHAHNFHHFLPEYGLALTELYDEGVPCLLTVHEVWSEFICEDLLERTKWDTVITVSQHVAAGIRQQAPHLTNLRLLYMGINTDLFSPQNGAARWRKRLNLNGRPTIMHPARMLPWKGVVYSVRALELLKREFPDVLLIITDTDDIVDWIDELKGYKQEVLQEIERRGLKDNVLCQTFNYLDLPAVYANCDVVIYPTIGEEPFGLVPVEAMACGRPVVVSQSGGLVESVVDGKTGFVIEKRNEKMLAQKIAQLLRDKELARRMGEAGRRHAVRTFNRERMARETAELYAAALRK